MTTQVLEIFHCEETRRAIAAKCEISKTAVSNIKSGKSRRRITGVAGPEKEQPLPPPRVKEIDSLAETIMPDFERMFLEEIRKCVEGGSNHIPCIVEWCDRKGVEVESVSEVIKKNLPLFVTIQCEAEDLNVIKRKVRLPI
jgi:hypothetical protein